MIAHPEGIYNDSVLSEETQIVQDTGANLFMTATLYQLKAYCKNLKQLGEPVDKTK